MHFSHAFRLPMRATPETEQYIKILRKILGNLIRTNTILVFTNFSSPKNQFNGYLQQRMDSKDSVGSLIADAHSNSGPTNFDNCFLLCNEENGHDQKRQLINRVVQLTPNVIFSGNQLPWKKVLIAGAVIVGPILTYRCKYEQLVIIFSNDLISVVNGNHASCLCTPCN